MVSYPNPIFAPPTGGTTARSMSAHFADALNVKDFGAVGDGVTDDTVAIQAALTAQTASKGAVYIVNYGAAYIISASLYLPNGVQFIGVGNPTIKLANNLATIPGQMIGTTATVSARHTNSTVVGIIWDGNRANNINYGPNTAGNATQSFEGLPVALVSLGNVDYPKVSGCTFQNAWASGLWIVDCNNSDVFNNTALDCRKTGISIRRYQLAGRTVRHSIRFNRVERSTVGIHSGIFGNDGVLVEGNILYQCSDQYGFPSFAYGGTYPNIWPLGTGWLHFGDPGYVSSVNLGDGAGVELTGVYTAAGALSEQDINIVGNMATECQMGFRAEQAASRVNLSGNFAFANLTHGFFFYSCTYVNATGNYSRFNGGSGFDVERATGQIAPIIIQIEGNIIEFNSNNGITLSGLVGCLIEGNTFVSNGQAGASWAEISLFRSAVGPQPTGMISIHGNFINSSAPYWILSDNLGEYSITITGNDFFGSPTTAKISGIVPTGGATPILISGNNGIVTAAHGTATAPQNSFVTVAHGLQFTPDISQIVLQPQGSLVGGSVYPGSVTSTNFAIIMPGGPATLLVSWRVIDVV